MSPHTSDLLYQGMNIQVLVRVNWTPGIVAFDYSISGKFVAESVDIM